MIKRKLLLILDRDGTIIEERGYLGKNRNWKDEVKLRKDVIKLILFLQERYETAKIVVTNQSGVARGYFGCSRVEEINGHINGLLKDYSIKIDSWQYCPDIDAQYEAQRKDIPFKKKHVREKTKRKPSPAMIHDALKELNKNLKDFDEVIVLGDKEIDDGLLAKGINAKFISAKDKNFQAMLKELKSK